MRRKARRYRDSDPDVDLTPMVDVVFLLLVFFIFAIKPLDVLATMPVHSSGGGTAPSMIELRIQVLSDGYLVNGKSMALTSMDLLMEKTARFARDAHIAISSKDEAQHHRLVSVLNLCERHHFENISLAR